VSSLLANDRLVSSSEEAIYEATAHWMTTLPTSKVARPRSPGAPVNRSPILGFVEELGGGSPPPFPTEEGQPPHQHLQQFPSQPSPARQRDRSVSNQQLRGVELLRHIRFPIMDGQRSSLL